MALTDAGLTVAGTAGPPVNLPPVIISTPNPFFIENVADTYDMSQNFTDDGLSTVLTNLLVILPNGLSYNGNTHILTYDGIGSPSVSQHQLQVDDQVNAVVTSSIFNIEIQVSAQATIFVQDDGSDDNSGIEASPYATLDKAISVAVGGDIIEMRKSGTGIWTYNAYTTFNVSGEANNEITLRIRAGDRVNFYPTATSSGAVWWFTANYWILDGSIGEMYVGDTSLWNGTNGGQNTYPYNATLRGTNSAHHIELIDANFSGAEGTSAWEIDNTCHHWHGLRLLGAKHGHVKITTGGGEEVVDGDGLGDAGTNMFWEDCNFGNAFGGHSLAQWMGNSIVIRGCTLNKNFSDFTDQPAGDNYRVFGISSEQNQPPFRGSTAPWGPTLMEDCIIRNGGTTTEFRKGGRYKLGGRRTIFRYNYVFDNHATQAESWDALLPEPVAPVNYNNVEHTREYSNTYDTNVNWILNGSGVATEGDQNYDNKQDARIYNNINSNITEAIPIEVVFNSPYIIVLRNAQRWSLQGHPDKWLGAEFKGNMIDSDGIHIRIQSTAGGEDEEVSSLASAITTWPLVWFSSNNTNAPTYVNASLKTRAGFALQAGSNGEDEAVEMAAVTANSSGVAVTLDDCFWIFDGFDLSYYGVVGDFIAFYDFTGSTLKGIRQIISVNSQTSITLSSAITIIIGDIVFPVLSDGSTVIHNTGAAQ